MRFVNRISILCFICCLVCSICLAQYWGHLRSYLGEDYDYVFKLIGMTTYAWNEKYPDKQKIFDLGSEDGYRFLVLAYHKDNQFVIEKLYFNDEDMAFRYVTARKFNDYNDLVAAAKEEDAALRSMGAVHYNETGIAHASDWQYSEGYKIDGYYLVVITEYTPRGEYKASLNLIDKKFDRIQNEYY